MEMLTTSFNRFVFSEQNEEGEDSRHGSGNGARRPLVRAALDFLDNKAKGSWSDFASLSAVFDISRGFLNATQITFGGSRTECQFAIQDSLLNG